MARAILVHAKQALRNLENTLAFLIGHRFPPVDFCEVRSAESLTKRPNMPSLSIEELMKESFLWAVPKSRRTLEKRSNRKFGWKQYVWKPLVAKTNLLLCNNCGHSYEAGHLCPNCYKKVQEETKAMQEAVQAELGLEPIEKEVVILYRGEKQQEPDEFWEGKRIVELDKERPAWFSKNLLEKTTQAPATSTDVKPTELA